MHIIWKTNKINNKNLRYWSDDGGVSWYWIRSLKPWCWPECGCDRSALKK